MDFRGGFPEKEWGSVRFKAPYLLCSWLRVEAAFSHLVVPDTKILDQAFSLEYIWNNGKTVLYLESFQVIFLV